jgi:hypothetical protein
LGQFFWLWEDFHFTKETLQNYGWAQPRSSCRSLFKQLEILPVPCQCIVSLMNFIVNNKEIFPTDSSIHNIDTRNKFHLHRPNVNVSCFQKSTFSAGVKILNSLPPSVAILKNGKAKFKAALRKYTLFLLCRWILYV